VRTAWLKCWNSVASRAQLYMMNAAVSTTPSVLSTDTLIYTHQTWNWVNGSSFTSGSSFWPGVRPEFFQFSKKAQDKDIMIYIFVKIRPTVIEILTFNKWSSKFYFREASKRQTAIKTNWQTSCPLQTFVYNISRHLEFIIEQGQLGLRVAGFPGHWVTKCDPVPCLAHISDNYGQSSAAMTLQGGSK